MRSFDLRPKLKIKSETEETSGARVRELTYSGNSSHLQNVKALTEKKLEHEETETKLVLHAA